jgi:hypothetical protein
MTPRLHCPLQRDLQWPELQTCCDYSFQHLRLFTNAREDIANSTLAPFQVLALLTTSEVETLRIV